MGCWIGFERRIVELVFLVSVGLGVGAPGLHAQAPLGVNLKWKHNPTNSLSQLGGYNIYYGPRLDVFTNRITVGPTNIKARIEPLVPGADYYLVMTAFNTNGLESLPTDPPLYYKAPIDPPPVTNTPPSITAIANQALTEDHESRALAFSISDLESAPNALTVRARSSNPQLIPEQYILLGGTGNERTLMIVPQWDQWGSADITLEVRDPQGGFNTVTFAVTVTPVNDPPVITSIPNQTLREDAAPLKLPFYIFDSETPPEQLQLQVFSSDETIVPLTNIFINGTGISRSLNLAVPKDAWGSCIIDVMVVDANEDSAWITFAVIVLPVNDPPTLDTIPSFSVDESSGSLAVPLTGITSGAPNEAQPLVVTAISSDPQIIPNPRVDYHSPSNSASLLVAPLPGTNGSAVITVTVSDGEPVNGTTSRSFTVSVSPFNNPPVILGLPDLAVLRIPSLQLPINFSLQDPDTPADSLTVTAESSDTGVLPNSNLVFSGSGTQRTLTVRPVPGRTGLVTITILVSDGEATVTSSFYILITLASS